jgi:hypothetical protein
MCVLFNDAVGSSDYMASNDRMISCCGGNECNLAYGLTCSAYVQMVTE